jgi:eukaryotic-like serine/threonine-protein kinase
MAESALDRDLLFGIIALRMDFVSRDALTAAIQAWGLEMEKSLDQVLVERGALAEDERSLLDPLVGKHLEQLGDDAERSLAALSAVSWITLGKARRQSESPATSTLPTAAPKASTDSSSFVAGRFHILRSHARGGLGEVFVALDRDLDREVALKQIRAPFADDDASRARFIREAQVTGGLEHPGIVPVHALGKDAQGRPYYAMRFIRGESLEDAITRFHAVEPPEQAQGERSLELRKLLRRLLDVCNAIEYAHSRGVLHRDLKPSNIIVGTHGETLVVDWGLAKAMGAADGSLDVTDEQTLVPSATGGATETLPGLALGTPSFMSPEQASGARDVIGPASDVYSLGATLYCLLTGRAPFARAAIALVLQAVQEGKFPPPRQVEESIPRPLEAICLKAMAREPRDRYASPRALADDIERWMADEAVSALPEPLAERTMRWMRRKRTTVTAAAAAVLVALVGLAVVLAVQARANHELTAANERERARFDLAMESIRTFHSSVSQDVLLREPQFQALRGKLLHGAREFSLKLEALLKDQTDVRSRRALAQAYDELAALTDRIGSKLEALELYRHVLALRRELARGAKSDSDGPAAIARCLLAVGSLQFQTGHPDLAMSAYEEAMTLLQGTDRPAGLSPRRADLAACYHQMGEALAAMGRSAEAMVWFQKGRSLLEALVRDHPNMTVIRTALARSHDEIGVLLWAGGRPAAAVTSFEKARAIMLALARDHGTDTELRRQLASSANAMGYPLHSMGKTDQALESFESAREILEVLVHDNPAVTEFRRQLAYSYAQIATLLSDGGRPAQAVAPFEKARAILETLTQDNPAVAEIRNDLARCYSQLGVVFSAIGKPAEALESCEKARAIREALVLANPSLASYRSDLAVTLGGIGALYQTAGRFAAASVAFRRAIELLDGLPSAGPEDSYNLACYHSRLAGIAGTPGSGFAADRANSEAGRAMDYLRRAVTGGFRMLPLMALDHDLDALRSRADFQILMMDVTFPGDPFAR